MAVGRISGPLLKANLLRDGVDIAFETDLLYLDVNNQRIGVKNGIALNGSANLPTHELQVTGTTRTTDLIVDNRADIGDITVDGNTISTTNKYLNLGTLDNVVYQNKLRIDSIDIAGNVISTNESNANLELKPNGTGSVDVLGNMNVDGNIHATGNITADGNITLGDEDTDSVIINAEVASNIIPDVNDTYDLGSDPATGGKQWKDLWVNNITASSVNSSALSVDGIDLTLRPGNIFYVSVNGDDTNSGDHPLDPYLTIQKAISVATSGDTILVIPGVYEEVFPIEVPVGVTVKGTDLRGVTISPTVETRYNDAFLLNGGSTVEDLTVKDFYSGGNYFEVTDASSGSLTVNVGTSPFAHTYVSGGTLSGAGIGDQTVTGATYDHTTGELVIAHSGATATVGPDVFISGLIFSCNGGNRTFPDNGYAFRFATDFEVSTSTSTRSPYIKNVSVITRGSNTGVGDLLGFDSGDAGKGVYVDGAYATTNSNEASMLFHSCTFITPGVDALTATNGARIEWLNCFTYFANRGLYAFDSNDGLYGAGKTRINLAGLTGPAPAPGQTVTFNSTDNSTIVGPITIESVINGNILVIDGKNTDLVGFDTSPASITFSGGGGATTIENLDLQDFGAEIRMIGSANVYGNYGLVGDGAGVIVYAIGQNLAYIGNGKESTNDPNTVIQANEVVETNGAKIRYNSVDHKGDFRVGDLFYVNQQDGTINFSVSDFNIDATNGVTINSGGNTTFIDGTKIETGDWRISGNTLETLTQDAELTAASGQINLNSNVNISGNLDVTGNITIGGNLTIGDETTDTIQIVAGIDSSLIPNQTATYDLGSPTKLWRTLYGSLISVDDIEINDNYIQTTVTNSSLELRANGTGEILIPTNDASIAQNLYVLGNSNLSNTNITGTVTHIGDYTQVGTFDITGVLNVTDELIVEGQAQFEDILINDNYITTTASNSNLELRANGTGEVLIPSNNVTLNENLTVTGLASFTNISSSGTITANSFSTGDILIDDNFITTTLSNSNLELRASGTGEVLIPTNDVVIDQNLNVAGVTTFNNNTNINGSITQTGDTTQTGDFTLDGLMTVTGEMTVSGNGQFEDILITGNVLTTTLSNSDLELRASGTGEVVIPSNDVIINQDLTILGTASFNTLSATGTIVADSFSTGDILIDNNVITTTQTNSNLELVASGTGEILIPENDVNIVQNLNVDGDTTLSNTIVNGSITHIGNTTQTGNTEIAGNFTTTGTLEVSSDAQFEDIKIANNVITTTLTNSDLELRANGTGIISIPNNDLIVGGDLTVGGTLTLTQLSVSSTIVAPTFDTGDITISQNVITTNNSNSNLELRANGSGEILIPNNDVVIDQNLTVNQNTTLADTTVNGSITHTGNTTQTGNISLTGNMTISGVTTVSGQAQLEEILINDNYITTTSSNADLELRANGTGNILIPNNNVVINNDVVINGDLFASDLTNLGVVSANSYSTGDILIDDNYITTTLSNSNLELRSNGTGSILIDNIDINNSTISSTTGDMTLSPATGYLIIDGTGALKIPTGTSLDRPNTPVAGQLRYNTDLQRFEGYNGTAWISLQGLQDLDGNTKITAELTDGANDDTIRFYTGGNLVADLDINRFNVNKLVLSEITIDNNTISTTSANTDLNLSGNGTGNVIIENLSFDGNSVTNTVADAVTTFQSSGTGYFKVSGNAGLVIPSGDNLTKPDPLDSETGMLRYNTQDGRVEVFNGAAWVSVAGTSGSISTIDAENLAIEYVIVLG